MQTGFCRGRNRKKKVAFRILPAHWHLCFLELLQHHYIAVPTTATMSALIDQSGSSRCSTRLESESWTAVWQHTSKMDSTLTFRKVHFGAHVCSTRRKTSKQRQGPKGYLRRTSALPSSRSWHHWHSHLPSITRIICTGQLRSSFSIASHDQSCRYRMPSRACTQQQQCSIWVFSSAPTIGLSLGPYGAMLSNGAEYTGDYRRTFLPESDPQREQQPSFGRDGSVPSTEDRSICGTAKLERCWRVGGRDRSSS